MSNPARFPFALVQEEQAVLEKVVRETQRRASIIQGCGVGLPPNILVSEPSTQDIMADNEIFLSAPRRCSTQSMGPVVVPVSLMQCTVVQLLFKSEAVMTKSGRDNFYFPFYKFCNFLIKRETFSILNINFDYLPNR